MCGIEGKSNTLAETKKQAGGLSVEKYRLTIHYITKSHELH